MKRMLKIIVFVYTASKIMLSIASNDAKALTAASGVGIKLAQRIILELKDSLINLYEDDELTYSFNWERLSDIWDRATRRLRRNAWVLSVAR